VPRKRKGKVGMQGGIHVLLQAAVPEFPRTEGITKYLIVKRSTVDTCTSETQVEHFRYQRRTWPVLRLLIDSTDRDELPASCLGSNYPAGNFFLVPDI
jgi:hypothetical protein